MPGHTLGDLLSGQPSSSEPIEYDMRCDADGGSGALYRVASVRPSRWICYYAVDLDGRDPPPLPQTVDHLAGERRSVRCAERFMVEDGGNLAVYLLQTIQLGDALPKLVLIGHTPLQPVLTCRAGLPDDLDPDLAAPTLLIQYQLLDYQPNDLLAVG